MASAPLLEDYTVKLLDESKVPSFIPKDPISRYNYVIDSYNHENNRVDDKTLKQFPVSSVYQWVFSLMNHFLGEVLLIIILLFLPGINIIMFLTIFWAWLHYSRFLSLYRKNEEIIEDPFKNMIYSPEMCDSINKINWFFHLEFEDLQGLTLNLDTIDFLKTRNKDGKVGFMIYNNVFWNFYQDVFQKRNLHVMWTVFSAFLLVVSGLVVYMYYYFISRSK